MPPYAQGLRPLALTRVIDVDFEINAPCAFRSLLRLGLPSAGLGWRRRIVWMVSRTIETIVIGKQGKRRRDLLQREL